MSLTTFVKISNISNLSDARYCAGMGVNQLGFNFNKSSDESIDKSLFNEISNWISGVRLTGEFGDTEASKIIDFQKDINLDIIELSNIQEVEKINLLDKPLSFRLNINHLSELRNFEGHLSYLDELVDQVVLTSETQSLFEQIDEFGRYYTGRLKLIKGYGISSDRLEFENFYGIQLKGTPEQTPGLKDYGEVMDILEKLEVD